MFEVGEKVRESRRRREKDAMLKSNHTDTRKVNCIELSDTDARKAECIEFEGGLCRVNLAREEV